MLVCISCLPFMHNLCVLIDLAGPVPRRPSPLQWSSREFIYITRKQYTSLNEKSIKCLISFTPFPHLHPCAHMKHTISLCSHDESQKRTESEILFGREKRSSEREREELSVTESWYIFGDLDQSSLGIYTLILKYTWSLACRVFC